MKFDNLSKALKPLSFSVSGELKLNDQFSITVLHLSLSNQVYNARSSDYSVKVNYTPERNGKMFNDIYNQRPSEDAIAFVANVLVLDWSLTDDEGVAVTFTPEDAIALFSDDRFGATIFAKVADFAISEASFVLDWEAAAIKN